MSQIGDAHTNEIQDRNFNLSTRVLYFLFYAIGGVYTSKEVPKQIKYYWGFFNMINLTLFIISGSIYYVVIHRNVPFNSSEFFTGAVNVTLCFNILCVGPMVTTYFRVETTAVLEYISNVKKRKNNLLCERFNSPITKNKKPYDNVFLSNSNLFQSTAILTTSLTIFSFIYLSAPLINFVWFGNEEDMHFTRSHAFLVPFYAHIPSVQLYYLFYATEFILGMIMGVSAMSHPIFFFLFARQMNNIIIDYCESMHYFSEILTDQFEKHMTPNGEVGDLTQLYQIFEDDLIKFIGEYDDFVKSIDTIRSYVDFFYTLIVITVCVAQFSNIYVILGTNLDPIFKFKQIMTCAGVLTYFYVECDVGKLFDDMGEAVRYEVYNLPWYYMPPSIRKNVYIFLNHVQKPHEFKAFVIYPITMALFPRLMHAIYSYFNILRTVINRRNN